MILVIREDPVIFSPNWDTDPDFSKTLEEAQKQGVIVVIYTFKNTLKDGELTITPLKKIPLKIHP